MTLTSEAEAQIGLSAPTPIFSELAGRQSQVERPSFGSERSRKLRRLASFGQLAPLSGDLQQAFFRISIARALPGARPLWRVEGTLRLLHGRFSSLF
jgi:hypothetical protein